MTIIYTVQDMQFLSILNHEIGRAERTRTHCADERYDLLYPRSRKCTANEPRLAPSNAPSLKTCVEQDPQINVVAPAVIKRREDGEGFFFAHLSSVPVAINSYSNFLAYFFHLPSIYRAAHSK
jgi:hypothetical protein